MDKKILITGANGFIGSHLTERLVREGQKVFCMIRRSSSTSYLKGLDVQYLYCDFTCPRTLPEAVKGKDEIYHLGGIVRALSKKKFFEVNCTGTNNLVKAVKRFNPNIKKFVYLSSQAAAGPGGKGPVSDYGKSKKAGEEKAKKIKNCSILRPAAVYGSRDRDFLSVFKIAEKGFFLMPAGAGRLSFIHVKDCISGIISSLPGEHKFLSDGNVYSWIEVAKVLEKVIKKQVRLVRLPVTAVRLLGAAGSAAGKITGNPVPLNIDKVREMEEDWAVDSPGLNVKYDLVRGFTDTYRWYKHQGWL